MAVGWTNHVRSQERDTSKTCRHPVNEVRRGRDTPPSRLCRRRYGMTIDGKLIGLGKGLEDHVTAGKERQCGVQPQVGDGLGSNILTMISPVVSFTASHAVLQ